MSIFHQIIEITIRWKIQASNVNIKTMIGNSVL